jgi:transcriptional regulator with XRE-family HTH domain
MDEKEFKKRLGKNIKFTRMDREMSQQQLAELIDDTCHTSYISAVERGQTIPNVLRLIRIAQILNVTVEDLLKGTNYLK